MVKNYSNLLVVPFSELLDSTRGLSDHKGGPVFGEWDSESVSRHCRWGNIPIDLMPFRVQAEEELFGEWAWIGPICHHFGHQIADFSMRIQPTLASGFKGNLLFAVRAGEVAGFERQPEFFREIIDYFGIKPRRLKIVNRPVKVEKLLVWPQAETIFGPPPESRLLRDLSQRFSRFQARCLAKVTSRRKVFVTRSKLTRGVFAGEAYLDRVFKELGYEVLHPEEHELGALLNVYVAADLVVFSEGSALHAIQFLGAQLRQVVVLERGQTSEFGKNFLRNRCRSLAYINATRGGLSARVDRRYRESGLSFFDVPTLKRWLVDLGADEAAWDNDAFEAEERRSVLRWLAEYIHARPNLAEFQGSVIREELGDLGHVADPAALLLIDAREKEASGQAGSAAELIARAAELTGSSVIHEIALETACAAKCLAIVQSLVDKEVVDPVQSRLSRVLQVVRGLMFIGREVDAVAMARKALSGDFSKRDPRSWTLISSEMVRAKQLDLSYRCMEMAREAGLLQDWMWKHWLKIEEFIDAKISVGTSEAGALVEFVSERERVGVIYAEALKDAGRHLDAERVIL